MQGSKKDDLLITYTSDKKKRNNEGKLILTAIKAMKK